jgi:hypothetical protein
MVQMPNEYHYKHRLVDALKPEIRNDLLEKGFTPEFSDLDDIVKAAVDIDDAQRYQSGYNSLKQKTINVNDTAKGHSNTATQTLSSNNPMIGTTNQTRTDTNAVLWTQTVESPSKGGGKVAGNSAAKNPVCNKDSLPTSRVPQSIPSRNAVPANNSIICYNCNQPGHYRINCPYSNKDRRVAAARVDDVTLDQHLEAHVEMIEQPDEPHPEELRVWSGSSDQEDDPYPPSVREERSIDDDYVININAISKAPGYIDRQQLFYGVRIVEPEPELRVSSVVEKGELDYDHRTSRKAQPLPTRGKENEPISLSRYR